MFTRQFRKQLAQNIENVSDMEKKNLGRLVSGFVFSLTNSEFYLHFASWRVVIGTSVYSIGVKERES
jgi:hypothetical protein